MLLIFLMFPLCRQISCTHTVTVVLMAALINQLNKIPKQQPETVGFGHFSYDIKSCALKHEISLKITPHLLLRHTADIYIIPTVNCHTRPIFCLRTRMWQNTSPISLGEHEQCRSYYLGKHRQRGAKGAVPARSNRCRLPLSLWKKARLA